MFIIDTWPQIERGPNGPEEFELMRLRIKSKVSGESRHWVARTVRGFNKKQVKEIAEFRAHCRRLNEAAEAWRRLCPPQPKNLTEAAEAPRRHV